MKTTNPNSFPNRMLHHLDLLAHQVLEQKQYARLQLLTELLAMFSRGAWDQMEEEVQLQILKQLDRDFHVRAWDDWPWKGESAPGTIRELVKGQRKAMAG